MKPILSPEEAAALDRESRARGITVEALMENAGRAVARAAVAVAGGRYGRRAVVVCGKGNNGGDGLVAARRLAAEGLRVAVCLRDEPGTLRDAAATNLERLSEVGVEARRATSQMLRRELERADVAVDALFGTGFRGTPEGEYAGAIEAMNASGAPIVAVDIPSGVNGETGAIGGEAVWATVTVTFGAAKPGLLIHPGAARAGPIEVADIGFPPDLLRSDLLLVEDADVASWWPRRLPDTNKRASGVVLAIGGSRDMNGAVRLMAKAAYRAGAGLVTAAVPAGIEGIVQSAVIEATFLPLPETPDGTVARNALDSVADRLDGYDAVAVGPGMTTNPETQEFVRALVRMCPKPLVLDADGLNAFAGRAGELAERGGDLVLTPHAGEFGRLAGMSAAEVIQDRIGHVRKLAGEVEATVLLKGDPTVVAEPGGEVRVVTAGSAVLATGGTGDVLTGAIAALLARGLGPLDAATAAAHVHGVAGSLAGIELGEGTMAGDVVERLPAAVAQVRERA